MNILFWGLTIGVVGKIMLAVGVILAHTQMAHEMRIDAKVIRSFRIELVITVIGLLLIIFGYFMELYFYNLTPMLTCVGPDCAAAIGGLLSQ